jgi:hypothetical protein
MRSDIDGQCYLAHSQFEHKIAVEILVKVADIRPDRQDLKCCKD